MRKRGWLRVRVVSGEEYKCLFKISNELYRYETYANNENLFGIWQFYAALINFIQTDLLF